MSDNTVYNLLRRTTGKVYSATLPLNATYEYKDLVEFVLDAPHAKGDAFTLSFDVRLIAPGRLGAYLYNPKGNTHKNVYVNGTLVYRGSVDGYAPYGAGPEWRHVAITWEYVEVPVQPVDRIIPARMWNVHASTVGATVEVRNLMCVRGTTPAAWAPAEGEGLAGGGALMSANLLEGVTPTLMHGTTESDGVWHNAGRTSTDGHVDWLVWDLVGQSALATNQTYHVGLSTRGASANSATLRATIGYKDAAGNVNWATSDPLPIGTSWGRAEATIVVPSGMTPFAFYVAAYGICPETWMAAPTLSLGSPVPLASSAHTPYATQDHVMVTYATKASLKVTDDSVKAEVSARAQTDQNVADLSSRLTQTANSLSSEISDRRTAITTVTGLANAAQSTADSASEQTVELSSRLDQSTTDITATIESKVQTVQQGVDDNASDVKNLNDRLSDEIRTRKSFMRFSEESSDPTLTLGQTDSPAQVKLTNRQLQFLYMAAVVAYISNDALLIRNATILQQLVLGGFAFVPRENGNLALKWVG